ncbi:ATP-binding protein [Ruminococcus flavefaciens]|nr:ATP-binding protein [Ruminococcus flavefaciens]
MRQARTARVSGLYISKYFIEQMNGELMCYNNGKGFTVSLRLRLVLKNN